MHTASWCRCWVETWVPACRSSSQMLHFCMALASFQPKIGHRQNWKRLTPSFYLWHWLAEIKSGQKVPKCQGSKIMWHEHVLYFRPILCGQSFLAFHELQDQEVDLAITISISPYFLFIDIIYLEPKWPLFWLLHQNRGQTGSRYIYIHIFGDLFFAHCPYFRRQAAETAKFWRGREDDWDPVMVSHVKKMIPRHFCDTFRG